MSDETSNHQDLDPHEASDPALRDDVDGEWDEARGVLDDARRRLAEVPADVVVANHVMGLYELAAIHLGAETPDLTQAALAIDAVGCLVDGLGDRLGPDASTLRDALANIRLAFVQIKGAQGA
ncbi:MAG: hypothetical protein R2713_04720 [Ilumatobacteraceae bacterium]|nr:hypothetical protein [Acidimicrobiales bacterium]MCB9395427.1 hypothetical protein [Acidimicrobiaceae bacterium]